MRFASVGQAVFAATLLALGIQGLVTGEMTAIWAPIPRAAPAHQLLAYLSAAVALGGGPGLLLKRFGALASRVLVGAFLLWALAFKVFFIVREPKSFLSWYPLSQTVVMLAAAWALYAVFASDWDRKRLGFAVGERGLRVARVLYGLVMIYFGLAHFLHVELTAPLVPGWLPWHVGWAYFTGGAFIAAGVAVLTGVFARLAVALSAVQLGLFTLLVWGPVVLAGPKDAGQWQESILSWAITTAAWVMADSYRGRRWLRT